MNRILKKIIGWTIYAAVLVALVMGIPKALSYYLKTSYPMAAITSGSMWPALKSGDLVLIRGVSAAADIQNGDIVVYQNRRGFTIHRVVIKNGDTFITKGDANNVFDNPVPYTALIGKTVMWQGEPVRVPLLGNLSIFLNKKNP
ncbi:MAG: signal peptidase I [Candidatus Pacebacteria bacterium]|jgi:signal peptidase|nr:signal peptidase I [Candidatus Paceibacterota bacterium]